MGEPNRMTPNTGPESGDDPQKTEPETDRSFEHSEPAIPQSATREDNQELNTASSLGQLGRRIRRLVPDAIRKRHALKLALVFFSVLLILGTIGYSVHQSTTRQLNENAQEQLTETATLKAGQFDTWITGTKTQLRYVSQSNVLQTGNRSDIYFFLTDDLKYSNTLPFEPIDVHYVDTETTQIIESSDTTQRETLAREQGIAWAHTNISNQPMQRVSVTAYQDAEIDTTVLAFVTRVPRNPDRALVVLASLESVSVAGNFEQPSASGHSVVVARDGTVILNQRNESRVGTQYARDGEFSELQDVLKSDSAGYVELNASRISNTTGTFATGYASLEEVDWTVLSHRDRSAVFALRETITQRLLLLLAVATLGFALIGILIGRGAIRSIRELAQKANRMESGDLDISFETNRIDEIGRLYHSFGSMQAALKQRLNDVEQSRQQAEQLNEQLKVLDRLLRHNLNNEMNTIMLSAETIQRQGPESLANRAELILEKSDNLLSMTEKQREIIKALSASNEYRQRDVTSILQTIRDDLISEYPEATISLDVPDTAEIQALESISDTLHELMENAIIHNDSDSPELDIEVTCGPRETRIDVADNAQPIPENDRNILTGDQEIDALNHGSGMGLWLVFWVVRQSGGRLEYNQLNSHGNVVTVILPTTKTAIESAESVPDGEK